MSETSTPTTSLTPHVEVACPFQWAEAPPPSVLDRMLHRESPLTARSAIEARLASKWPALPTWSEIEGICEDRHLTPEATLDLSFQLFCHAYERFFSDGTLSQAESECLDRLRLCLNIGEDAATRAEDTVAAPRFEAIVKQTLASFDWKRPIKPELNAAAAALGLSPAARERVYQKTLTPALQAAFDAMLADHRVSPDEFIEFSKRAAALGIRPEFNAQTTAVLHQYAAMWRIDHGELPTIDAPIHLLDGEVCHFAAPGAWLEHRRTTKTFGYINHGVSFRIARGMYYHVGASRPTPVVTEGLAMIDAGSVYITNRRLLFSGRVRSFAIKLDAIVAFHVYADALAIEKATGKHPHLAFDGETETAAAILGVLLRN